MSTQGLEAFAIDTYIYATLAADATLVGMLGSDPLGGGTDPEINVDTIPTTEVYPYVYAQLQSAADTLTVDGTIVLVRADYIIRAVDRAESYQAIAPIAARIFELLHQSSGATPDGQILKCIRQRPIHYPEITEAVSYRHMGGLYRFWVEGT